MCYRQTAHILTVVWHLCVTNTDRQTANVVTVVWYLCLTGRCVLTFQLKIIVAYAFISLGTGRTKHIAECNTTAKTCIKHTGLLKTGS